MFREGCSPSAELGCKMKEVGVFKTPRVRL